MIVQTVLTLIISRIYFHNVLTNFFATKYISKGGRKLFKAVLTQNGYVLLWFINVCFLEAFPEEVCVQQAAQFSTTKNIQLCLFVISLQRYNVLQQQLD